MIKAGETKLLKTGLIFEVPKGYFMMVAPRVSFCLKEGLNMPHSVGIIDEDYRGELLIPLRNLGNKNMLIKKHERIAQLLFIKYSKAEFNEVKNISKTKRNKGGFGSTGKF
jgi:dUTP pyrophosphatase